MGSSARPGRARRRRLAVAIAGALLLLALALIGVRRAAPARSAAAPAAEAATPGAAARAPAGPGRERGVPARLAPAEDPHLAGPTESEVRAFRSWRTENLRRASRFPGDSLPLTRRHLEALTVVEPDAGAVKATEDDPAAAEVLIAFAAKPFFQLDEPILLHAAVVDRGRGTRTPARITGTLMKHLDGPHDGALATIVYRDDGAGGDPVAGDGTYTAHVSLDVLSPELATGQVDVEVTAVLPDGRERFVVSQFRAGTPGGRLTGTFRDRVEDGHLILEADAIVDRPGRYHLQGGLVALDGTPVVWAQQATVVDRPGPAVLSLRFFGLAFHEAGVAGPYVLSFVSVAETGRRPVLQGPVLRDAHTTAAYALSDFSAEPHHDPAWEETIRHAEAVEQLPLAPGVVRGR